MSSFLQVVDARKESLSQNWAGGMSRISDQISISLSFTPMFSKKSLCLKLSFPMYLLQAFLFQLLLHTI